VMWGLFWASARRARWPLAIRAGACAAAHFLDCPVVGGSQRKERSLMMNHTGGWMGGSMGGGMWLWTGIGVVVVVLLVVVINKLSKK